jgi:hypothetical protein
VISGHKKAPEIPKNYQGQKKNHYGKTTGGVPVS